MSYIWVEYVCACWRAHHFVFSDFSSCWRPQGNNTATHWGLCFHFCTVLPSVALHGKHFLFVYMRSYLQWTVPHLCRCLLSSARIYCFRCVKGFSLWMQRSGCMDCFMQRGSRKSRRRASKQTCAAELSEPSVAHPCCACTSVMITSTLRFMKSAFAQRREVSVGLKPEEHPLWSCIIFK